MGRGLFWGISLSCSFWLVNCFSVCFVSDFFSPKFLKAEFSHFTSHLVHLYWGTMTKHELFSNIFKDLTVHLSKKMPQWIRATLFMGQQKETPLHWDLCCFFSSQAERIVCESWSHQTIIMKNTTEGDLFFNNNIFEAPPPQQGFIFSFTLQMRHPLRAFLLMQRFTTG